MGGGSCVARMWSTSWTWCCAAPSSEPTATGPCTTTCDASRPSCGAASIGSATRGLAIFACAATDLWKVIELPKPVRTCVVINHAPAVGSARVDGAGARADRRAAGRQAAGRSSTSSSSGCWSIARSCSTSSRATTTAGANGSAARRPTTGRSWRTSTSATRPAPRSTSGRRVASSTSPSALPTPSPVSSKQALHPYLTDRLCGRVPVGVGASACRGAGGGRSRRGRGGAEAGGRARRPAQARRRPPGRRGVAGLPATLARRSPSGAPSASWSRRASPRRGGARPARRAGHGRARAIPTPGRPMERVGDVVEDAIEEALTPGRPRLDLRGQRRPRRDRADRRAAPVLAAAQAAACCRRANGGVGRRRHQGARRGHRSTGPGHDRRRAPCPHPGRRRGPRRRPGGAGGCPRCERRRPSAWGSRVSSIGPAPCTWVPTSASCSDVPLAQLLDGPTRASPPRSTTTPTATPWAEQAAGAAAGVGRVAGRLLRHRNRRGDHHRRAAAARRPRLRGRAGPHGRGPERPAVPVRQAGLLGALRVGHRARRGWLATRPWPVVSMRWWRWPAVIRRRCAASTSRPPPGRATHEAQAVLDALARWIALGLANLTNVLDPAVIVIGGGLVDAADLLLARGAHPVRRRWCSAARSGPWCRSCPPSWGSTPAPSAPPCCPRERVPPPRRRPLEHHRASRLGAPACRRCGSTPRPPPSERRRSGRTDPRTPSRAGRGRTRWATRLVGGHRGRRLLLRELHRDARELRVANTKFLPFTRNVGSPSHASMSTRTASGSRATLPRCVFVSHEARSCPSTASVVAEHRNAVLSDHRSGGHV